jgi:ribosomal protein S18 acetylase RimI-like enzyme
MVFENTEIRPFCNNDLGEFTEMFCTYFRNDFNIEITDNKIEKICSKIARDSISGVVPVDLLVIHGRIVGFVCYQVDTPHSDWCEREGWGFIREIHTNKAFRGKGLGTKLVTHAEKALYASGVEHIYLTSDKTGAFWGLCGYKKTEKVSNINHDPIYEK